MKYWLGIKYHQVSPPALTLKEQAKSRVKVRNSDIAKTWETAWTANTTKGISRPPRSSEILVEEKIQSHVKEINRQNQGRQKMKHKWRDPGSGVSFSKSNIARVMRGRVPQNSNFLALRSQNEETKIDPPSELTIPLHNALTSALQQVPASISETSAVKRSSGSNEQSPNYYGFEDTSTDSLITAAPRRRAVDADNFWPPNIPVVETF